MTSPLAGADSAAVNAVARRFQYPPQIQQVLRETTAFLATVRPRAVLLVGSAARGELTYRHAPDGRLEMFSDIELICLADARLQGEVNRGLDSLTASWERDLIVPSQLFHVECMVTPRIRSGPEARSLFWYEGGTTYQRLFGEDGAHFGVLAPGRLSLGLIAQLVVVRLFWMMVQFPVSSLRRSVGARSLEAGERELFLYSQVRNLLDVPSIWLPHEGIFECGYRERTRFLQEHFGRLRGRPYFADDLPALIGDATRRKLTCDLEGDPLEWYLRTSEAFQGLATFLVDAPPATEIGGLEEAVRERWVARNPRPASLKFKLYAGALMCAQALRPGNGAGWLLRRSEPEAELLCFLLRMHAAARSMIQGRDSSTQHLHRAREALHLFSGEVSSPRVTESDPARTWNELRWASVGPVVRYLRKLRGHESRIRLHLQREAQSSGWAA